MAASGAAGPARWHDHPLPAFALLIHQFAEHLQLPPGDLAGGIKGFVRRALAGGIELRCGPAHQLQQGGPATGLFQGGHHHQQGALAAGHGEANSAGLTGAQRRRSGRRERSSTSPVRGTCCSWRKAVRAYAGRKQLPILAYRSDRLRAIAALDSASKPDKVRARSGLMATLHSLGRTSCLLAC